MMVDEFGTLACGGILEMDKTTGIDIRCKKCGELFFGNGVPEECMRIFEAEQILKKLKGKGL